MKDEVKYFREELSITQKKLEKMYSQTFDIDDLYLSLADYYNLSDKLPEIIFKELSATEMVDSHIRGQAL